MHLGIGFVQRALQLELGVVDQRGHGQGLALEGRAIDSRQFQQSVDQGLHAAGALVDHAEQLLIFRGAGLGQFALQELIKADDVA